MASGWSGPFCISDPDFNPDPGTFDQEQFPPEKKASHAAGVFELLGFGTRGQEKEGGQGKVKKKYRQCIG